jgi:small subunit ribosomal protein S2
MTTEATTEKPDKAAQLEKQEKQAEARAEKAKELLKDLFAAGVHLGHETHNWNPKMEPYIHSKSGKIYIINLLKTVNNLMEAGDFMRRSAKLGRNILFVGTSKQGSEIIRQEADRVGAFYINQRWLGGLLTNFETIRSRLNKLREFEHQRDTGGFKGLGKKEISSITRQINKLNKSLGGLKKMRGKPEVVFIADQKKDKIAVEEARKAGCTIIALADTDCDPTNLNYVIPANDNSMRSIKIITKYLADSIQDGLNAKRR